MDYKLCWDRLLSADRERASTAYMGHRNAFDIDYDRIIGSSSVRRLQDKAQVFPLQENDFTRTRLTHSIEVSALAKSLGKAVGKKIEASDASFDAIKTENLTSLLQTLGLIHDLGNPPFGHYGETIIRQWFADWFNKNKTIYEGKLSEEQKKDYVYFDGNVQNLRIVSKLQMLNDQYGVNFTYATLASLIKYPWGSADAERFSSGEKKKYGYYLSEKNLVDKIWASTGLGVGIRHPATFLLEAADDITYICDDIEDGVKKQLIDWEKEYTLLQEEFCTEFYKPFFDKLNKIDKLSDLPDSDKVFADVLNFRNNAQGIMFFDVVNTFMSNYMHIMNGDFGVNELLDCGETSKFKEYLKGLARKYCFRSKEVLSLELIGDSVIKGLLNIYIPTIIGASNVEDTRMYPGKLYHLISSNFKYINKFDYEKGKERNFLELDLYEKMQLITDYISGMTDSFAVNLYKEITGYKIP